MSWENNDSQWFRKQHRRVTILALMIAVIAIASLAFAAFVYFLTTRLLSSTGSMQTGMLSAFFIVFAIAYPVSMGTFVIRSFRKEKRILNLVPEYDGRLCPKCRLRMDDLELDTETDATAHCAKCSSTWPVADLHRYWEQFVLARRESYQWLNEERAKFETESKERFYRRIIPWAMAHPILWNIIIFSIVGAIYVTWSIVAQTHWSRIITTAFTYIPIGIGVVLLSLGVKRRRGVEPHCAACEYPKSSKQINNADSRCPECGANWNQPGATIYGLVTQNKPLLYAGLAIFFIAVVIIPFARIGPLAGATARFLPNSALIRQVGSDLHVGNAVWREFRSRQLTAEEINTLANLCLDQRAEIGYFDFTDAGKWLDSQIAAGTLSTETIKRYYTSGTSSLGTFDPQFAPTWFLIETLGSDTNDPNNAWDEIETRQLSDEEIESLANGVMDLRLIVDYFTATAASDWLDAQVADGLLSPKTIERYYSKMLTLKINGPEFALVNEQLTFTLEGKVRSPNELKGSVVMGGFYLDDDATPIQRWPRWQASLSLDQGVLQAANRGPHPASLTTTFSSPGTHTIRSIVWFVIPESSAGWLHDNPWDRNGAIILPPNPVWSQRIEVTHEIEISR